TIPVWFTPTLTTAELREKTGRADAQYELVCNQLCGIGHYRMKGYLTVETEEEFQAWLASRAPVEGAGDDFWG
ncbi:MAG TPA: cytochrome c oxidase subunit II, partial [Thermoanaerobaculia bacterium]